MDGDNKRSLHTDTMDGEKMFLLYNE